MSPPPSDNGRSAARVSPPTSVLVTGAAGFIGSHLCDRLLVEGAEIWGLDNFDDFYDPSRKRENLRCALRHDSMRLVEGDVRDPVLLDGLMTDVEFDAVVHLASRPDADPSVKNPERTYDTNVRGTLTLLEAVARHRIPRLLYASSDDVYSEGDSRPYREDMPADRPLSPYAASKRAGEMLCHVYHNLHDLTVHCLRLSSVFGPRQRPDLAISELARLLKEGRTPELNGEGATVREYTFVDDVVDGILLSLERTRRRKGEEAEYSVINLGGGEAVELSELAERLADAMADSSENRPSSGTSANGAQSISSLEKGRKLLGYRPQVSLDEGLAEFSRWLRDTSSRTSNAPDSRSVRSSRAHDEAR